MAVSATAPLGGIVADLGGRSRPLILRNAEIERFEEHYAPFGFFEFMGQLLGRGHPQARHCRDIVALGLIGGGLSSGEADKIMADIPPADLMKIRLVAHDLVMAAFAPIIDKKKAPSAGSQRKKAQPIGTLKPE